MVKKIELWLLVCVILIQTTNQELMETVNQCVAQTVPEGILHMIQMASGKILQDPPPPDYSGQLLKVQEKLSSLNDSLFGVDETTKEKVLTSDLIMKYQKQVGEMLDSVIDSNKDVKKALDTIQQDGGKTLGLLNEKATEHIEEKEVMTNITALLKDITKVLQNTTRVEEKRGGDVDEVMVKSEEKHQNISLEILGIEKETNNLVKKLMKSNENEQFLRNEIAEMNMRIKVMTTENEKLKTYLTVKGNTRPSDCNELYMSGRRTSGVYEIYPYSCDCDAPIKVWCDMTTDGGGWTVLINRGTTGGETQNFTTNWRDYEAGFGDAIGEYWIGLGPLSALTSNKNYALRLEVTARSKRSKWGRWDKFYVAGRKDKYRLKIGDFSISSTIGGDVFRKHNNQFFSTVDNDNDASLNRNCATKYKGGWWYGRCYDINPTGILGASDKRTAVSTAYFRIGKKSLVPLKKLQLKIKPSACLGRNRVGGGKGRQMCGNNNVYDFAN